MSKGPAPPQVVAPWEISAGTKSQPWPGDRQSWRQLHILLATNID
jgi:hypothetical protein